MTEHILILDFGSQVTQLIARRIREAGVYCEIRPYSTPAIEIERLAPQGVVLSGGPASLTETEAPRPDDGIYTLGIPLLGICYGQQAMCAALGGTVESTAQREFGRAHLDVVEPCALFDGVWQVGAREQVWMSHGDAVAEVPSGFRRGGTHRLSALRRHRRRCTPFLRHPVPPRSGAHPPRWGGS